MSHLAYVFSCPQAVCLSLGLHGQVWTSTSVWLLALTWQLSQMTSGGIIRRWLGPEDRHDCRPVYGLL